MQLRIVVSSVATAHQVVDALTRLGHNADAGDPLFPGLVTVALRDPSDAPTVHRIAAMIDHPAAMSPVA